MYRIASLPLLLALVCPALADEPASRSKANAVAPFVDGQTILVAHIDFARVNIDRLYEKLTEVGKRDADDLERSKQAAKKWLSSFTQVGAGEMYSIFSLADLPEGAFVLIPLKESSDPAAIARRLLQPDAEHSRHSYGFGFSPFQPGQAIEKIGNVLVAGSKRCLQRLKEFKPAPRPEIALAFEAAGDTAVQVLVTPSDETRRVVTELLPVLPADLGGPRTQIFADGIRWASLGIALPPKCSAKLVIHSKDASSAQALHDLIVRLYERVIAAESRTALLNMKDIASALTPKVDGNQLRLGLDLEDPTIRGLLRFAQQEVAQNAGQSKCTNNLRQLVLAMHQYHDAHKSFPAIANFDKDGKPLLSWRVHLLPFLGKNDLHKQFHLDEPWDSENNKKLIAQMPDVFRCPVSQAAAAGKTTYLVPVGDALMFTGNTKGVAIRDITDGTSNTICLVDANEERAVIWTKPEDWQVDAKKPKAGLENGHHGKDFLAAFADGSVHSLTLAKISAENLYALFTRAGGEVVDLPR